MFINLLVLSFVSLAAASPLDFEESAEADTSKDLEPVQMKSISPLIGMALKSMFPWMSSWPVGMLYNTAFWAATYAPTLLLGCVVTVALCTMTPACRTFDAYALRTLQNMENDISAHLTPARLLKAAELVTTAIQKYRGMQSVRPQKRSIFQFFADDKETQT